MLARKVVTRRGRRFRGYFPSRKLHRMVAWESLLERDAILLLEVSPGVVSFQEQPTVIQYFDGQDLCDYYPDFEVVLADGALFHLEVKTTAKLKNPKAASRFAAIATHYQEKGLGFRIVTEQELQREPLLGNAQVLAYLKGNTGRPLPSFQEIRGNLGTNAFAFSKAEAVLGRDTVLHLIVHGMLGCDLTQPLAGNTLLSIQEGGRDDTVLL